MPLFILADSCGWLTRSCVDVKTRELTMLKRGAFGVLGRSKTDVLWKTHYGKKVSEETV